MPRTNLEVAYRDADGPGQPGAGAPRYRVAQGGAGQLAPASDRDRYASPRDGACAYQLVGGAHYPGGLC